MWRLSRAVVVTSAAVVAAACLDVVDPVDVLSESGIPSTDSIIPPPATTPPQSTIRLLEPEPLASIAQNDSTTGCQAHEYRGYGFQIRFEWAPPDSAPAPVGYHLYVKKETASYPLIDISVPQTEYSEVACNAFVIDGNLGGWFWTVEALDSTFSTVAHSETRLFVFAPCRLANGQACSAPAGSSPGMAQGNASPVTGVEHPALP